MNKPHKQSRSKATYYRQKKQERIQRLAAEYVLTSNNKNNNKKTNSSNGTAFTDKSHGIEEFFDDTQISNSETLINESDHEVLNNIRIINNQHPTKTTHDTHDLICTALLSLFFSGKFTRESFKQIIELSQLLTNIKIPKTFEQLMLRVSEEKLDYTKVFFCQQCVTQVDLSNSKQRTCGQCNNR